MDSAPVKRGIVIMLFDIFLTCCAMSKLKCMTVLLLNGGITESGPGGWRVPSVVLKISFKFCLADLQTSLYVVHSSFTSCRCSLAASITLRLRYL